MSDEIGVLTAPSLISCEGCEAAVIKLGCKSEMRYVWTFLLLFLSMYSAVQFGGAQFYVFVLSLLAGEEKQLAVISCAGPLKKNNWIVFFLWPATQIRKFALHEGRNNRLWSILWSHGVCEAWGSNWLVCEWCEVWSFFFFSCWVFKAAIW